RWIVALFGKDIVPFSFVGLQSGRTSTGHRTLGGFVRLAEPEEYFDAMEAVYVMVDQDKRRDIIWAQFNELTEKAGGVVIEDNELLTEITHLVEYPTALMGKVDISYMNLPEEVITTPMKDHQRYFPVRSADGELLPYFLTVRNGDSKGLDIVREGNNKVLKARLEDAAFYYREDQKKPLESFVSELDRVVYHDKLGTVGQRVTRLRQLSAVIADNMGLSKEKKELVDRTAYLAKADLVTHMVYDFPELQGIMGAYYAAGSREDEKVCKGIKEHYWPRFAGDSLPETITGMAVSIADKLDAIVGSFGIGIQPTGSQDPYALRRQALGVAGILMKDKRNISMSTLLEASYRTFEAQGVVLQPLEEIRSALNDFFSQRVRYLLLEDGFHYDTIEAVMAQGSEYPYSVRKKAGVLTAERTEEKFTAYLNAYVRCVNLSKKEKVEGFNPEYLVDESEIILAELLAQIAPLVSQAVGKFDFSEAYIKATELVPSIEKLFDSVMIMVEDKRLKTARLGLLNNCVSVLGCLGELTLLS
ncbi:MAG: glycine--tRNA ligase subunit beta, partial [Eubacteriales bacterium]